MKSLKFNIAISFSLFLALIACDNNSGDKKIDFPYGKSLNIDEIIQRKGHVLDTVRNLVPLEEIASYVKKDKEDITIQDATPYGQATQNHNSCFFKWPDPDIQGSGILLRLLEKPKNSEIDDYVTQYIYFKLKNGEEDPDGNKQEFHSLEELGDAGAYNTESGKYYWRLGDQVLMSIQFNSHHSAEEQHNIALGLGSAMIRNYIAE